MYQYPVNYIAITQGYHNGKALDFGWCGHHHQNIYSVADGKVYKTETQKTGGKVIFILHDDGNVSCYGHLNSINVKKGQKVVRGQKIGTMGATGKVTAEHLHFQITSKGHDIYGKADVDPFSLLFIFPSQDTSKVKSEFSKKLKYFTYTTGAYVLLYDKVLRKSPNLGLNSFKVKECSKYVQQFLTSKKPNDTAKLKKGLKEGANIREIIEKDGRIWGRYTEDKYLVLCNQDGTPQAYKL